MSLLCVLCIYSFPLAQGAPPPFPDLSVQRVRRSRHTQGIVIASVVGGRLGTLVTVTLGTLGTLGRLGKL
jgi:hypothetical protein